MEWTMKIEEAIQTALNYENNVRDHYKEAAEKAEDPKAKKFFDLLAREEQGHVEYLLAKQSQWEDDGKLEVGEIGTLLPKPELLRKGLENLQTSAETRDYETDVQKLYTALQLEEEVSALYKEMVAQIDHPDAGAMFQRFLEIEDGHTAIVQAEIDVVTKTGFFFDFQEWKIES
jgi:rubrerythrin